MILDILNQLSFKKMSCQLLNIGYLEITREISRKLVEPGQREPSLKKWFGRDHNNSTLRNRIYFGTLQITNPWGLGLQICITNSYMYGKWCVKAIL